MPVIPANLNIKRRTRQTLLLTLGIVIGAVAIALTFNSTASAQANSHGLIIQELNITQTGETSDALTFQASVTIHNPSQTDFSNFQRVDYQINDGERQLAYIVSNLPAGETLNFTFNFELMPGDHTVRVLLGDTQASQTISVAGADIAIKIIEHRFNPGSIVEFDIHLSNNGELDAKDLSLSATWQDIDGEDTDEDITETQTYDGELPTLKPGEEAIVPMSIEIKPGTYNFTFQISSSTIEADFENNSAEQSSEVEFIDLRPQLISTQSLGWDGEGNALMAILVEVENVGVDGIGTFQVSIECEGETTPDCSYAAASQPIPAGNKAETELRVWLPVGETQTRIFAAEDEDTFRWGNANVIEAIITTPPPPEQTWNLIHIADPNVISYWSDGSANVQFELTLTNNGTDEPYILTVECTQGETVIENCGTDLIGRLENDLHPTVTRPVLRLPQGDTVIRFNYGAEEAETTTATVPERIIGVERDVWDCFSDTSLLNLDTEEYDIPTDLGIGCAGWERPIITKWPVGEKIKIWSHGAPQYLKILDETLIYVSELLNVEFEPVATKDEAQMTVHTGVSKDDADFTGLGCIDFAGCAQTPNEENGQIKTSNIAIWLYDIDDEEYLDHLIRATTLHELLHGLTDIIHRHHDSTSVMSYHALDYTTVDGMDRGLFELIGHPLVQPGMTFDEVLELIVFADELNDPPEPMELSAQSILRRAHAALLDANSFSFRVSGGWPQCRANFGPAQMHLANLRPHFALWEHFHDGNDRYYRIENPLNWSASEWWLKRGNEWQNVEGGRIGQATDFRAGLSSALRILLYANIYAEESDYYVVSRFPKRVEIEFTLDEPNPPWSRGLDLEISITVQPETYQILEYEMNWKFKPRGRYSCDTYTVRADSSQYGIDFTFPDAVREASALLTEPDATDEDEASTETAATSNNDAINPKILLPLSGRRG